jgi:hypothetical protein
MLKAGFRSSWLIAAWVATMVIIVGASVAMGAHLSTTVLVLALSVAPAIVIALLAHGQPSPSVGAILHSVEMNDRRS